jgi:hypothetical protein
VVRPGKRLDLGLVVVLTAIALTLAPAACGDDDERATTTETDTAPTVEETGTEEETEPPETEVETEPAPDPEPTETEPSTSPEDQPGGAGDEEPARSLALFTGENGRITPRVVRVPAFISIRVELRSADGAEYGLTFEGERLRVSAGLASVSTTLDGLRPGARLIGTPANASNRVLIEATAEPGP